MGKDSERHAPSWTTRRREDEAPGGTRARATGAAGGWRAGPGAAGLLLGAGDSTRGGAAVFLSKSRFGAQMAICENPPPYGTRLETAITGPKPRFSKCPQVRNSQKHAQRVSLPLAAWWDKDRRGSLGRRGPSRAAFTSDGGRVRLWRLQDRCPRAALDGMDLPKAGLRPGLGSGRKVLNSGGSTLLEALTTSHAFHNCEPIEDSSGTRRYR